MAYDYQASAAQALALPIDDSPSPHDEGPRNEIRQDSTMRPGRTAYLRPGSNGYWRRFANGHSKLQRRALGIYNHLTPLQKAGLFVLGIVALVLAILFLIFNERIFAWLSPIAEKWRHTTGGWVLLFLAIVISAFPPLIGYSTWVTLAGFVYGFPHGWFIAAPATVVGSVLSFLVCSTVLKRWSERFVATDKRFAAVALTLKYDGLKLLCMVRLCPLPYSISNGAIATIPTVNWINFGLATAIASVKLLITVFVGSRLNELAEHGNEMDGKTKAISYLSIIIGIAAGVATGIIMYRRTQKRAEELEQQEAEGSRPSIQGQSGRSYSDEPFERTSDTALQGDDDAISLRTDDAGEVHRTYSDDFSDGDDDPFSYGDSDGDEESGTAPHR